MRRSKLPTHPECLEIWRQIERDRRAVVRAFWAEFRERYAAELARATGATLDRDARRRLAIVVLMATASPTDLPLDPPYTPRDGSPHFSIHDTGADSSELEARTRRIQ